MNFKKMTHEELLAWIVNKAHSVSDVSESNLLMEAREELLSRLNEVRTVCTCPVCS